MAEEGDSAPYGGREAPGNNNLQPAQYFAEPLQVAGTNDNSVLQCKDHLNTKLRIYKPWGLSKTHWGTFLICDRETNSVLEFDQWFKVIRIITQSTPLKTPSKAVSIIQNDVKYIIVTEKGERRVVKFNHSDLTLTAKSIRFVGDPWDVCVTKSNLLLVTNEKHSIEILNVDLLKVSEIRSAPKLIHPRGICNGLNGEILISDFVERVVVIIKLDPKTYEVTITNCITFANEQPPNDRRSLRSVDRLQGLCLDNGGNILVADSRRNVIKVSTYRGDIIRELATGCPAQGVVCGPFGWIGVTGAYLTRGEAAAKRTLIQIFPGFETSPSSSWAYI